MSDSTHLVLDVGSAVCKVGFSRDENPTSVFSTIIGVPTEQNDESESYIGNEAQSQRDTLTLSNPVEKGVVKNWDHMEKIWQYIFDHELKVSPEEHVVLLTETPLNPKANKERITEVMFETFNVPATCIANQAVLSAYAAGRMHGVVLDSGDGTTHAVPLFEGLPISHAITSFPVSGSNLTTYLMKMLSENRYNFNSSTDREIVREIKEQFCYVSIDDNQAITENSYELPDGQVVVMGNEAHFCPESLFRASYLGYDDNGVHNIVFKSIMRCSMDIKKQMYKNIILSGGTTNLPGFGVRLQQEINKLVPETIKVDIISHRHEYSTWTGGSILASIPIFKNLLITKEEYEEIGSAIIHKN